MFFCGMGRGFRKISTSPPRLTFLRRCGGGWWRVGKVLVHTGLIDLLRGCSDGAILHRELRLASSAETSRYNAGISAKNAECTRAPGWFIRVFLCFVFWGESFAFKQMHLFPLCVFASPLLRLCTFLKFVLSQTALGFAPCSLWRFCVRYLHLISAQICLIRSQLSLRPLPNCVCFVTFPRLPTDPSSIHGGLRCRRCVLLDWRVAAFRSPRCTFRF